MVQHVPNSVITVCHVTRNYRRIIKNVYGKNAKNIVKKDKRRALNQAMKMLACVKKMLLTCNKR